MEPPTKAARFYKVCNLAAAQTMETRRSQIRWRIDRVSGAAAVLAALLIFSLPSTLYAQATSTDQTPPPKKTAPDAAPPPALPNADSKAGVVKPPDIDPKMAKQVPDVDPGMTHPPADKPSGPPDPSAPKVQPK